MADAHQQFWDMVKDFRSCMLTTVDSGVLRSRPLAPLTLGHDKSIYFLVARDSAKIDETSETPQVNLSFASEEKNEYISVSGVARYTGDVAMKKELWNEMAKLWFKNGPEDPEVVVLIVEPQIAEFWDGRQNFLKKSYEFAKARLTNLEPDLGDNRKLKFA